VVTTVTVAHLANASAAILRFVAAERSTTNGTLLLMVSSDFVTQIFVLRPIDDFGYVAALR